MILRALYSLLLWLATPLIAGRLWLRSLREPGYSRHLQERLGRHAGRIDRPVIWVHAVSVGEVRASAPLVRALQKSYPGHLLLVTCMTATGREAIDQVFGPDVLAAFLPYDFRFAVRRFLRHFRPRIGVLMETEIWINLLAECRAAKVPVLLANGRMSQRSARRYQRLAALTRPAFESLAAVCAQSEADANRFAALGAHRVQVAGNLKFDVEPDAELASAGADLRKSLAGRKVLVLASTREGEEKLLLQALSNRLDDGLLVVLVPRHPQRFDEVDGLISAAGWAHARRSRGGALEGVQVLLGDTMGEMSFYYGAADVAVIGGSLLPFGGQNPIEASAVGVPVVIGPHMENFSEVARLALESGAALQAADAAGAIEAAFALLADPARRAAMGAAGKVLCAGHRGATVRHMDAARELLQS